MKALTTPVLCCVFALAAPAFVAIAQEQASEDQPAAAVEPAEGEAINLAAQPLPEFRQRLLVLTTEELQTQSDRVLEALRAVGESLVEANIEARQPDADPIDDATRTRLAELGQLRDDIAARARATLEAIKSRGGDVEQDLAFVRSVAGIEIAGNSAATQDNDDAGQPKPEADQLRERVDALIAGVQADPPVHERDTPWRVSIAELQLELQPLRAEQIAERLDAWLTILQRQIRLRIRMDIAISRAKSEAERAQLAERAGEQQAVIDALVDRIRAVIATLEKRGGDATAAKQYVSNATGQQFNFLDPVVLAQQARAKATNWLTSETGGIAFGVGILGFLITLTIFWVIARVLAKGVSAALNRTKRSSQLLRHFLVAGTRRVVLIVGLVVALDNAGVDIAPLVAAIGAIGLVIGLALQGTLSNFASGILILFLRPFDVGDVVDAGGINGKVQKVTLFTTTILSFDNQINYVPNNKVWGNVITNVTGLPTRRVDLTFSIAYADDIDAAIRVLERGVTQHEKVLADPKPTVRVHTLGDNSVNIIVRPWCRTSDYWDVYWDLMHALKVDLDEAGITIPFPQRDLHLPDPLEVVVKGDTGDGTPARASS